MNRYSTRTGTMGLLLGLLAALTLMGQAMAETCERDPAAELDRAVSQTLSAVQSGNADALLNLISDDGMVFNPEGSQVSYRALETQFDAKTGHYCALFSCGGRPGAMGAKFRRGQIDTQIDTRRGLATVFINANTNDELHLNYKLRDCRWELTGAAMVE